MSDDIKPGTLRMLPSKDSSPEPNIELIAMLEEILKRAEAGEVSAALILAKTGDTFAHDFSGIETMQDLLGFNTMCDIAKAHLLEIICMNSE